MKPILQSIAEQGRLVVERYILLRLLLLRSDLFEMGLRDLVFSYPKGRRPKDVCMWYQPQPEIVTSRSTSAAHLPRLPPNSNLSDKSTPTRTLVSVCSVFKKQEKTTFSVTMSIAF